MSRHSQTLETKATIAMGCPCCIVPLNNSAGEANHEGVACWVVERWFIALAM